MISKNLIMKIKRLEKDLTQKELGKIVGVTSQSISEYERGTTKPNYENMIKISRALGASVEELFFRE